MSISKDDNFLKFHKGYDAITPEMCGLHKSPYDGRDFLITSFIKDKVTLPAQFNIQREMTPVRSQSNEGSCAGFAGAGVKEWQEKKDVGHFVELSSRYIYEYAKQDSGHAEGTTIRSICKILRTRGICYEKDWPYVANKPGKPSPTADIDAAKYKIIGYERVTTIDELKQAVFNGYPTGGAVLCGLLLYKGAVGEEAKATGITPDPTCWDRIQGPIGGHALVCAGWCDNSDIYNGDGYFIFKGSWGNSFGASGYHFFSYKNVAKNMMDAAAMVDVQGSEDILTVASLNKKTNAWV